MYIQENFLEGGGQYFYKLLLKCIAANNCAAKALVRHILSFSQTIIFYDFLKVYLQISSPHFPSSVFIKGNPTGKNVIFLRLDIWPVSELAQ